MSFFIKSLLIVSCAMLPLSSHAIDYKRVFVFGDSTSDGGLSATAKHSYMKTAVGQTIEEKFASMRSPEVPADPAKLAEYQAIYDRNINLYGCSYQGRQTNGYTTAEYAAIKNYIYTEDTFFNYSVSGQTSNELASQINSMKSDIPDTEIISPLSGLPEKLTTDDLVIISIGANDLRAVIDGNATASQTVSRLRTNIKQNIEGLVLLGARKFILVNLFNVSELPEYKGQTSNEIQNVKTAINLYNQKPLNSRDFGYSAAFISSRTDGLPQTYNELISLATQYNIQNLEMKIFDMNTLFNYLIDAKLWPSVDATVYDDTGNVMIACEQSIDVAIGENSTGRYNVPAFDKYIFFDTLHFSRRAHQFFGNVLGDFIQ